SKVIIETFTSELLRHNPLGDSPTRRMPVYLPPGYDDSATRYPVIYLLAGFTGRGTILLNDAAFDENIQERLDRLILAGEAQPMIVVMPDCFTCYGGSQYLNSSATGPYEDYLIKEIIPFIDRRYRTRAEAGYRAVGGKSSGGYGALVQAMRHPDVFGALACHSGDIYFDYCYKPDFVKFLNAAGRLSLQAPEALGQFLADFWPKMQPKPANFFDVLHIAAMSACYSPNPAAACGFDLPFEPITGELRPEVWKRWLDHDPITMLQDEKHVAALRGMKLIYLDCGNRDEYALHYGARIFCQRLASLNIPYFYEEFDGGHRDTQFRYDNSFKAISEAFAS
ncbi:MAG TPA: alpha/beta hydrolase-fold protein, partial [Anaerolineae bacterium]|nr:alpha/beta hydrolase-fold protein [Anaerolineae bacterium]